MQGLGPVLMANLVWCESPLSASKVVKAESVDLLVRCNGLFGPCTEKFSLDSE
jgi:hypothetical protein